MTKLLHYLKPINCSFDILNNNNNNNNNNKNNNNNNNNIMGFRRMRISVNLGPIIVDLVTENEIENKLDVPVGTELANSCMQSQHFNTQVIIQFVTM